MAMAMGESVSNVDHHHHLHSLAPITPKQNGDPDPTPNHPNEAQAQAQLLHLRRPTVGAPHRPNKEVLIAYKECLKNHAAALGAHATDGCGEFMPSGNGGGPTDLLRCSACGCHRNFHRKEVHDGNALGSGPYLPQCHYLGSTNTMSTTPSGVLKGRCGPHELLVGMGPTTMRRDGDILMEVNRGEGRGKEVKRKRHRTKFTIEQKEKMVGFAEKAGWKIHKLDDELVQQFCQEVGIKRRVLKVWMHNNKHHFVKITQNNDNNHLPPPNDTISHSTNFGQTMEID
ncbi:hypothetical protein Cgig2_024914 [Carnegiea gigantea]|uniref:ZF-HD dimerization-type domain-containing protein n=1 Tax=Carnegiea gigantea TaxID=171969 RepID=A0A9Q1KCV5_9CARY|nr:hypothetical protein Cgig2_024914 [Carnegiea gigantea]